MSRDLRLWKSHIPSTTTPVPESRREREHEHELAPSLKTILGGQSDSVLACRLEQVATRYILFHHTLSKCSPYRTN